MDIKPKETTIQGLLTAIDWHDSLEKEFRNPILPDNLTPEQAQLKLEEIEAQRERHEKWGQALKLLVEKLKKAQKK
jgi:hypothetical protein